MNRYLAGRRLVAALNAGHVEYRYLNEEARRCIDAYIQREYLRQYQIGMLEVCQCPYQQ
jgi:hypothetical protein